MKTHTHIAIAFLALAAPLWADPWPKAAKENELAVPLESWVKKSTFDSAKLTEDNCIHIERNASVNLVNGLNWMPGLNGLLGVLVIHPFSPKRPALIEYPVTPADTGKFIKIVARGSDNEPGGKLVFSSADKILGETDINSEWIETGVQIPAGCTKLTLAWHAKDWYNEMLWIDTVEVVPFLAQSP